MHGILTIIALQITDGERLTLTLWFSRESSFDEDAKLLSLLDQSILYNEPVSCIPLPAPSNMYWYSLNQAWDNQQGYDIHFARLFVLGFDIYPTQEKGCFSEKHSQHCSNVFTEPLQLVREDKLYSRKFTNLLHALQVTLFALHVLKPCKIQNHIAEWLNPQYC